MSISMSGIESITDGTATLEDGNLTCQNILANENLTVLGNTIFSILPSSLSLTPTLDSELVTKIYTDLGDTTLQIQINNIDSNPHNFTNSISFNSFLPTSILAPSVESELVNKKYTDLQINNIDSNSHNFTKSITFNSFLPTSILSPNIESQLVTKKYTDQQITDIDINPHIWTNRNYYNYFLPSSLITPFQPEQFTTKIYVDTADSTLQTQISSIDTNAHTWRGNHTFNTYLPTSTLTPSSSSQLVTKTYVDSKIFTVTETQGVDDDSTNMASTQYVRLRIARDLAIFLVSENAFGGNTKGQYITLYNGTLTTAGLTTPGTAANTGVIQTIGGFSANASSYFNGITMPNTATLKIGIALLSEQLLFYLKNITSDVQSQLNSFSAAGSVAKMQIYSRNNGHTLSYNRITTSTTRGTYVTIYNATFRSKYSNSTSSLLVSFDCNSYINGGSGSDRYDARLISNGQDINGNGFAYKSFVTGERNSSLNLFPLQGSYVSSTTNHIIQLGVRMNSNYADDEFVIDEANNWCLSITEVIN